MSVDNGASNKVRAVVILVVEAQAYAKAVDANGHDFFIFYNAIEQTGRWRFEDLRTGSVVALTPIAHPKGLRGIDVQILEL